jgi:hypothetical protein
MYDSLSASELLIPVLTVTILFFAFDFWRRIREVEPGAALWAALVIALWVGLALFATANPAVRETIVRVPGLQPVLAIALVLGATSLAFWPPFRRAFDRVRFEDMLTFFYWRAVFGALLLTAFAVGRLPAAFAVPAGLGDMAVAGLMILLLALKPARGPLPRAPLLIWNTLGLLDLVLSVGVLAITVLRPWAQARGLPSGNFGLQLFVVPLFVAVHLHIFGRLWREARG